MKTPMSMTRRLIISLTAAIVLFWIAAAGLGAWVMGDELDEAFDSALQETSERLMPLLVDDLFQRDANDAPRRIGVKGAEGEEYLTYQLRDANGRIVLHSHDAQPAPFDAPLKTGFTNTPTHRIYTDTAVSGSLFLQIADPLDHRNEAMMEGAAALFLPLLLLVPLSVFVVWAIVRRSLAPIASMRDEIGARDGTNLAPLSVAGLPAELETMAISVDRLLERLRTTLDSEREFTANSAHELRTPIAGALAQTQRLIRELPDERNKERARIIEQSLANLSHLTEKLLQLARADSGIGMSAETYDLIEVIRLLAREFESRTDHAGRLHLDIPEGTTLNRRIDVDAFGIALRNLLENALIHSPANSQVRVAVSPNGTISISNDGAAVPAAQMHDLAKRFKRGTTKATGAGLGLAIASTLVKRMGGSLELHSPAKGCTDGFEAQISV